MNRRILKLLLFVVFTACQNEVIKPGLTSVPPALDFNGTDAMFGYYTSLDDTSVSGRTKSVKGVVIESEFKSMNDWYFEALDDLTSASSVEEHESKLRIYADLVAF